jgi:hypothetical protein
MRVGFAVIIWDERYGSTVSSITQRFKSLFPKPIADRDYGGDYEELTVVYIVDDISKDPNDPFSMDKQCKVNNRSGKFTHYITKETFKYVGIAVPIDIEIVKEVSLDDLPSVLARALLSEMRDPPYRIPKTFDMQRLYEDVRRVFIDEGIIEREE